MRAPVGVRGDEGDPPIPLFAACKTGGGFFFFFFFFFRSWGLQFHKMFFYSNRLLSIPTALI